jgi:hypothetical protein
MVPLSGMRGRMARKESNSIYKCLIIKDNSDYIIDSCPHSCPLPYCVAQIVAAKSYHCFGRLQKKFEMVLYQRAAAEKSTP